MTRLAVVLRTCGIALALGACVANTPQQDLAYTRWAACSSPYAQLQRINLDGRIIFQYSGMTGRDEVFRCLAQAGSGGPALPPPVGVSPPGGP